MGRLSKRTLQCRAARKARDAHRSTAALLAAHEEGGGQQQGQQQQGQQQGQQQQQQQPDKGARAAGAAPPKPPPARPPCCARAALLRNLGPASLRRYGRAFGLAVPPADKGAAAGEELLRAIARHFSASEVRAAAACGVCARRRPRACAGSRFCHRVGSCTPLPSPPFKVVDEGAVLLGFVRALRRDSSSDSGC